MEIRGGVWPLFKNGHGFHVQNAIWAVQPVQKMVHVTMIVTKLKKVETKRDDKNFTCFRGMGRRLFLSSF